MFHLHVLCLHNFFYNIITEWALPALKSKYLANIVFTHWNFNQWFQGGVWLDWRRSKNILVAPWAYDNIQSVFAPVTYLNMITELLTCTLYHIISIYQYISIHSVSTFATHKHLNKIWHFVIKYNGKHYYLMCKYKLIEMYLHFSFPPIPYIMDSTEHWFPSTAIPSFFSFIISPLHFICHVNIISKLLLPVSVVNPCSIQNFHFYHT